MIELNLPIYKAKIRKEGEGIFYIYDDLRGKYVRLTPEEWVRQCFVHHLIDNYQYPKGLMMNEVAISLGELSRRADTVVYDKRLNAKILIEYKAPSVKLSQKVVDQILIYDIVFQVEYIIITNGLKHLAWQIDKTDNSYRAMTDFPNVEVLLKE